MAQVYPEVKKKNNTIIRQENHHLQKFVSQNINKNIEVSYQRDNLQYLKILIF
jgi:hypothetical protein